LSPIATDQGWIVGRSIVDGPQHVPDYTGVASCVFTVPALASVFSRPRDSVITIAGISHHLRPEWLITITGIRTEGACRRPAHLQIRQDAGLLL
jgi:hypothetical protein